jgi:hypothetical protein
LSDPHSAGTRLAGGYRPPVSKGYIENDTFASVIERCCVVYFSFPVLFIYLFLIFFFFFFVDFCIEILFVG